MCILMLNWWKLQLQLHCGRVEVNWFFCWPEMRQTTNDFCSRMLLGIACYASSMKARPESQLRIEAPFIQYKDGLLLGLWETERLSVETVFTVTVSRNLQTFFRSTICHVLPPPKRTLNLTTSFKVRLFSCRTTVTHICRLGTCWGKSEPERGHSMEI